MQFGLISYDLTELKVFSINISKQKLSIITLRLLIELSGGKYTQKIKGFFLLKILFSKEFFHKMRKTLKQFYYLGPAIQQEIPICSLPDLKGVGHRS